MKWFLSIMILFQRAHRKRLSIIRNKGFKFKNKYEQVTYNYKKANTCGNGDLRKMYRETADASHHELIGFIDGLEAIGIYVRYNWVGHRDEWFLCTLEDVQNKEDFDVNQEAFIR